MIGSEPIACPTCGPPLSKGRCGGWYRCEWCGEYFPRAEDVARVAEAAAREADRIYRNVQAVRAQEGRRP